MVKGIYKITNNRTGEVYIGQAVNLDSRKNRHFRELARGKHHNSGMQKDHNRGDSFSFEILEELPDATKADLYNKESQYIRKYNSFREGYNQTPGGSMDQFKGRYEFGGGRLPFEKYKPTDTYFPEDVETPFSIKFCPNCGTEVKKPRIRCLKCGEPFIDLNKKVDEKYIKSNDNSINIKTKHVNESGVSFDFPEYYLIANVPDNAPDCVIALAKEDGTCDVMIEISSSKDRIRYNDDNFESSYKKYISDLGYYDIKSMPGFGYKKACFQSYINHELGNIKQTTYFDFRFEKDIRITFNTLKTVDYDCMNDLRIIENSINYKKTTIIERNIDYKKSGIIDRIKNKITYKTKTAIGIISILLTLIFIPFLNMDYSIITYPIFYMPTVVPAIFLILPSETIKYNKVLSIISILIVIPFLIFNLNDLIFMVSTLFDPTSYATFLDYIPYETWVVLYCLYNLVCAILLYIPTGAITNKTVNNSLSHNDVNEENKKLSNDIKKENNNLPKKDEMNSTSNKSIINFLFYCEDKNSNEIRLSKIKCFSWIMAILTGLLIDVHICLIPNSQGIYAENLIFSFIFFGFIMGIVTFIFSSIIVDIYKEHKQ